MLDLPATSHLLDDELGVHTYFDLGVGRVLACELEPGDETAVLGDVVGGDTDRLAALGDHGAGVGVADQGSVRRGSRIAPRPAISLDDDASGHSPDSAVRTRMRLHSGQRSTSSSGSAASSRRSALLISSRQPSHFLARRAAAPSPPYCARTLS